MVRKINTSNRKKKSGWRCRLSWSWWRISAMGVEFLGGLIDSGGGDGAGLWVSVDQQQILTGKARYPVRVCRWGKRMWGRRNGGSDRNGGSGGRRKWSRRRRRSEKEWVKRRKEKERKKRVSGWMKMKWEKYYLYLGVRVRVGSGRVFGDFLNMTRGPPRFKYAGWRVVAGWAVLCVERGGSGRVGGSDGSFVQP